MVLALVLSVMVSVRRGVVQLFDKVLFEPRRRVDAEARAHWQSEGGGAAEDASELALLRLFRVCHAEDRQILLRMASRFARQADRVMAASVRGADSAPEM